ncbi:ROK family protein [Deinococcus sp.]|uniref:ROK family protein n=1 Tax=Deinococcus sp. TaxID=47478 RepID=UPI003CC5539E
MSPTRNKPSKPASTPPILVVDIGGTHVKLKLSGQDEERRFDSGPELTPAIMVANVLDMVKDWPFQSVSMGYPGPVLHGQPLSEPHNLAAGWVGFDYAAAFGVPVKIINDAAMQALGSAEQGKLLFLGLGTGLGSAMVLGGIVEPMELAHLPYRKHTFEDYVGLRGLKKLGKKRWRAEVLRVVELLRAALQPDEVVLGGGNNKLMHELPAGVRLGDNANAFLGGFRLWQDDLNARMLQPKKDREPASEQVRGTAAEPLAGANVASPPARAKKAARTPASDKP